MSADLFVADTGEVDLPVVVCLHSLFIDHTMFDELVAAAAGRFRMVRPDFRGQGANPDATELVTMDQCADDILDLLDRLGLERVHVVAQSMGGDVAVRVAARRPEVAGWCCSVRPLGRSRLSTSRRFGRLLMTSHAEESSTSCSRPRPRSCSARRSATTRLARTSSHGGARTSRRCRRASRKPSVE